MANSMRAIRTRIRSIENTRQITLSMRMVSASKLRRAQLAWNSLKEYDRLSRDVLSSVCVTTSSEKIPLLSSREVRRVCYVLFLGSRGLCGGYNQQLLRFAKTMLEADNREKELVVVGRWGHEQVAQLHQEVIRRFDTFGDTPNPQEGRELADYLLQHYLDGACDEIILVYQQFISVLTQEPTSFKLLPMQPKESISPLRDVIFEPDAGTLLQKLTELVLHNAVYAAMLEAQTGEHAARMTAMTAATDNTEELIAKLSLELNHARQSAITTEISEIVGGANALEKK